MSLKIHTKSEPGEEGGKAAGVVAVTPSMTMASAPSPTPAPPPVPAAKPSVAAAKVDESQALMVAWLDGHFVAQVFRRKTGGTPWTRPEPVAGMDGFRAALAEAVEATGFRGRRVSLLLSKQGLVATRVERDEGDERPLEELARLGVQALALPAGLAGTTWVHRSTRVRRESWRWRGLATRSGSGAYLVYALPTDMHDALVAACAGRQLVLRHIVPATEAVAVKAVASEDGEDQLLCVLGAWPGGGAAMLMSHDGASESAAFQHHATGRPEQAAHDFVRRLALGAANRLLKTVSRVQLVGRFAGTMGGDEGWKSLGLDAEALHPDTGDALWTEALFGLCEAGQVNLLARDFQSAPVRRRLIRSLTWISLVAMLLSAVAATWAEVYVQGARREVVRMDSEIEELDRDIRRLRPEVSVLEGKGMVVNALPADATEPVALWFLAYLGQLSLPNLWIAEADVVAGTNDWTVRMQLSPHGAPKAEADMAAWSEACRSQMAEGPFRVAWRAQDAGAMTPRRRSRFASGAPPSRGVVLEGTFR